jgi:hypothetical protein
MILGWETHQGVSGSAGSVAGSLSKDIAFGALPFQKGLLKLVRITSPRPKPRQSGAPTVIHPVRSTSYTTLEF